MKHAKKSSSVGFYAVLAATVFVFLLIIILVIVFVTSGSDDDGKPNSYYAQSLATGTASDTTAGTTDAPDVPDTTATPIIPADTTAVTTLATEAVTEPATETETTAPTNPSPGNRNTDFTGCLFIGDSRTQGLMMYSGVRGATAYASRGLMVDTFFTAPAVDVDGTKISVSEAVSQNTGFSHVFIMFGVNELGWPYENVFREKYASVIDHVKAAMPEAKIIVQSIIPVTATKSANDDVYNNERIELFNSQIRSMCEEKGVTYFDLVPVLATDGGALPEDAAFDGVHLLKPYCEKWLDSLRDAM